MRPIIKGDVSRLRAQACVLMALLAVGFVKADRLTSLAEDGMFADDIVYSRTSAYQRIVITRNRAGFQLFLNGNLQFSSADEYRYHEARSEERRVGNECRSKCSTYQFILNGNL